MIPGDFITLHRRLLKSWLWDMPADQGKVAMTLLLMANWRQGKTFSGGKLVVIEAGQVMTSLDSLARESRCSKQTVRTALKNLEKCEFLTNQSTQRHRVITILNYSLYQLSGDGPEQASQQTVNTPLTPDQHPANTSLTPIEEVKNVKSKEGKTEGARRAHQIPSSWKPTEKHSELAAKLGVDVEAEAESFRDYWLGEGKPKKDWDATFRNRLRQSAKWQAERQAKQPSQPQEKML